MTHVRKGVVDKAQVRAEMKPGSLNEENRTVEFVFTTGAKVLRMDFWTGRKFYEELEVSEKALRMEFLRGGSAPFLLDHSAWSVRSQPAVIESAWLEGATGVVRVRFAKDADSDLIFQKIRDGILKNVSVGYRIHKFQEVSPPGEDIKTYRAVDWEPHEVSLVTIPADRAAVARSEDALSTRSECEFIEFEDVNRNQISTEGERNMNPKETSTKETEKPVITPEQVRAEERARMTEIRDAVRAAKLGDEFAEKLIDEGVSADVARKQVLAKLSEAPKEDPVRGHKAIEVKEVETSEQRVDAVSDAICSRAGRTVQLSERAKDFRGMSIVRIAEEMLRINGERTAGMSSSEIIKRAMTTTDFPKILSSAASKSMIKSYQSMDRSYLNLVNEVERPDFKKHQSMALGAAPELLPLGEHGEVKKGSLIESGEEYKLETFARAIEITRQAMINDDMDVFGKLPFALALAAYRKERSLIFNIIKTLHSTTKMSDGNAVIHASHKNVAASAAALNNASLGKMIELIRKQIPLGAKDGEPAGYSPGYLMVGAAREAEALSLVETINPSEASKVNVFRNTIKGVMVDAILEDAPYFLTGRKEEVDMIELAYLQGAKGLQTAEETNFNTMGVTVRGSLDIAAKVVDHRGFTRNAGV